MSRLLAFALATLCALPASARVIDRIVAVVNDEVVTWSEVEDLAGPQLKQINDIADPVVRQQQRDRIVRKALDELIGSRLIVQEAARRKLTVGVDDVNQHFDRIKAQQGWSDEQLKMYLASQGLAMPEFRKQVRDQLLRQRVVGAALGSRIRISDGDLRDYYREKSTQAQSEYEIEAAHIVLKVPPEASAAQEAARKQEASELLARARGGEDFAALAKKYSDGPAADNGGYLGTFAKGSMEPSLEKALTELDAGQVGGPVRTGFGWHVVKTISKRKLPPPPFEKIQSQLRRELREKRMNDELSKWIDELEEKAFIEVRL